MNEAQRSEESDFDRLVMRPGTGWEHLAGPVWEHTTKTRIHLGGLIRLPDKTFFSLNRYPECMDGFKFIKINGGNRKRGLMAWARNLAGA